jgi:hypothetical protein
MMCSLASLEAKNLKTIQSMERELGKPLLAFSCHDVRAAALTDGHIRGRSAWLVHSAG